MSTRRTVAILAVTQVASWGSLYYAFGVLAPAIGRELGLSPTLLYGAFAWSILVAGLAATPVGMLIDRNGGRGVMAFGSLVNTAGLLALALCGGSTGYLLACTVLGLGMALTLYEAAFATINRLGADNARQSISTVTLFGGLASTAFWPLTAQLDASAGWRATLVSYAALQLMLCMPLHLLLGRAAPAAAHAEGEDAPTTALEQGSTLAQALRHPAFWALSAAFAANAFIFSGFSVHLIEIIGDLGHPASLAIWLAALIGPMQVVGRLLERAGMHRFTPQQVARLAFAGLPAALAALLLFGRQAWAVSLFCILYGLSNGVLTILRGTLPQAMFGRRHYGAISGAMAGPALLAKAAGPLALAWLLHGTAVSLLLGGLLLAAFAAWLLYRLAERRSAQDILPNDRNAQAAAITTMPAMVTHDQVKK